MRGIHLRSGVVSIVCAVLLTSTHIALAAEPSPSDLEWLRRDCGDGALVHHAGGRLYLTELSTGKSVFLAPGNQPEFSPDSSKIAWIDGTSAKGRMRKGEATIRVIAEGVEPIGGVHWLTNDEVALVLNRSGRKAWYRVSLGGAQVELPGLTRLGTGGYETDVRLGPDGVWSYVAKQTWRTSDGGSGTLPGTCSVSISPDGRSVTSLHNPHKECTITAIRPGGIDSTLWWKYEDGFDNHRWSSNDSRYIVAVDEFLQTMAIMTPDGGKTTRMGTLGQAEHGMYGDFSVGDGSGEPWPGTRAADVRGSRGPRWPLVMQDLLFVWDHARASNSFTAKQGDVVLCQVRARDQAKLSRYFAMDLRDGAFHVEPEVDTALLKGWQRSGALTLEAVLTPGAEIHQSVPRQPAAIVTSRTGSGKSNFSLTWKGATLTWHILLGGKMASVDLFPVEAGRSVHLVLTLQSGRLIAYRDGYRAVERQLPGNFSSWADQRLVFGAVSESVAGWPGTLEGVALYDRALTSDEVRTHNAARAVRPGTRRPVPRLVVDAVLLEKRDIPRPQAYPQTLVVYDYRVNKILVGGYSRDKLLVAHWGNLNGKTISDVRDRTPGKTYRLVLESFDEHPELQGLQMVENLVDFSLPLYHDVSRLHGATN